MRFQLEWTARSRQAPEGTLGNQTPRRFLDYVVDGKSFYEAFGGDFISPLGWLSAEADELHAQRLLRKAEPDLEDRVALLVCPEDADLYCGAVTARIERDGDQVRWEDLAFSDPDWDTGGWHHQGDDFAGWPPLAFDVREYFAAISGRPAPSP